MRIIKLHIGEIVMAWRLDGSSLEARRRGMHVAAATARRGGASLKMLELKRKKEGRLSNNGSFYLLSCSFEALHQECGGGMPMARPS